MSFKDLKKSQDEFFSGLFYLQRVILEQLFHHDPNSCTFVSEIQSHFNRT